MADFTAAPGHAILLGLKSHSVEDAILSELQAGVVGQYTRATIRMATLPASLAQRRLPWFSLRDTIQKRFRLRERLATVHDQLWDCLRGRYRLPLFRSLLFELACPVV
jgi:hypothetical protein